MKQTAVEFLHSEYKRIFGDVLVKPSQAIEMADALAQAKEMFEQQIINARVTAPLINTLFENDYVTEAEQYYNETFKSE